MVKGGLRWIILGGLAFVGVACAGDSAPPPAPVTVAPPTLTQPTEADRCGAADLQWLIGEPRTAIPVPVDVNQRRVTCTTCPLIEDYSETRLNILYNRETALIERVYCG